MAFDGYGTFLRLRSWVVDATNSVKIRADFHDAEDNGFAAGLSNCITKDGQTTITQNIPWNSRRLTALADPINPQDASTKAYTDTKAPLAGGAPFTGDVVIKEASAALTLDGSAGQNNSIFGQKSDNNRWQLVLGDITAESGNNAGSNFGLYNYADDGTTMLGNVLTGVRSTGLLTVKGDPTTALGIVTKQYADAISANASATYLPRAGGVITGSLTVNGELIAAQNYIRFGASGSPGYLIWNGSSSYSLGGGGTIWHSGNFNPVSNAITNARLIYAGDQLSGFGAINEPYNGAVMTGANCYAPTNAFIFRWRYMQLYNGNSGVWFTIGYVG